MSEPIKCVAEVDSVSATDQNSLDAVYKSMETWVSAEDLEKKVEPIIDTAMPGNNPFKAIVNQWSGYFKLKNGDKRRFRAWIPDVDVDIVATIVLVHGYAEHSARYHHVAKYLCDSGYRVFGIDNKYHGTDPNHVGWAIKMPTFDTFVDDLVEVVGAVANNCPDCPYFLLGHSMGGLITLLTTLRLQDEYLLSQGVNVEDQAAIDEALKKWQCNGILVSGPAVMIQGNILAPFPYSCFYRGVAHCVANTIPLLPSPGVDLKLVTHDQTVIEHVENDPLMFGEKISARFAASFVTNASYGFQKVGVFGLYTPFMVLAGSKDKVTNPKGAALLYRDAPATDKSIKEYPGLFHEIFNEPEKDQILSDVVNWFNERK